MKLFQSIFQNNQWDPALPEQSNASLVFVFGDRAMMQQDPFRGVLSNSFSQGDIVGCSTSGEIQGTAIYDQSLCLTAVEFDSSTVQVVDQVFVQGLNSFDFGQQLATKLSPQNLKHVFLLSDGQLVNGTDLVEGVTSSLPDGVMVTGGLAGDDVRFSETVLWHNHNVTSGLVILIGLYGESLEVGYGHMGGWRAFGPLREITKSVDNVLYELDGKPALELYKEFLGPHAENLPASALLFPLSLHQDDIDEPRVRTILSIDEQQNSMLFAGSMPEGATCQLMRANNENLIDGASDAAEIALESMPAFAPELALLVSCVGRRLVLNQRIEDEVEAVKEAFPDNCAMTGFYSYGEISPSLPIGKCGLHNQTMTITLLAERES
ncbi:FIST signal transduction protein [Aliiglaciecola litoralis]|uniref:FIST N-terminal domain-containing protein n=1 Tax=Aliiglaciecola litoralis TaxID=582857 RepID=A0ABP3WNP8_9ALTE